MANSASGLLRVPKVRYMVSVGIHTDVLAPRIGHIQTERPRLLHPDRNDRYRTRA